MKYSKRQHDFGIVDPNDSSNIVGMVCVRDKEQIQWREFDDEYLAQQFFTGSPSYVNRPPERGLPLAQDSWRSGFGLRIFDSSDAERYFESYGIDARWKNQFFMSYKPSTITEPGVISSAATLQNTDMEADANWTSGGGTTSERSSTQAHGGTYSWSVKSDETYQDAATWDSSWQSKMFTFSCWVYATAGSSARIGINDGVDTTYSSYHAGDSAWTKLYVTKTLGGSATRLRVLLVEDAGQLAYFDDCEINSPTDGKVVAHAKFNDEEYIASGNILSKLDSSAGASFDPVHILPATITDMAVFPHSGGDILVIMQGTSDEYYYIDTSETLTESNASSNTYEFCTVSASATPTIRANDSGNTIRSTTNPKNGGSAWSAQTTIATSADAITDMIDKGGTPYIGKEDTAYYIDSSGNVQVVADKLRRISSTTSCKNMDTDGDVLMIPAGDQSLLEVDGSTLTWLSPALSATNSSNFNGRVTAITHDDMWWWAILDNGSSVYVLAGRYETIDGTTSFVWHTYQEISLSGCETAFTSNVYEKRIYVASTTSTESFYYIPLPVGYANVAEDTNRNYDTAPSTDPYIIMSFLHGEFRADDKAATRLRCQLDHSYDANIYFEAHYKKWEDTSWTKIDDIKGSSSSMLDTKYFSTPPASTMFQLKFTAHTDDSTKTPVMAWYQLDTILYPPTGTLILATVKATEKMLTAGAAEPKQKANIISVIDNAIAATSTVTIYDLTGTTKYVKFLPLPSNMPRRVPLRKDAVTGEVEWAYNLYMQEVTLS